MGKAEFLERMTTARQALNQAISGLTEEQMTNDLVTGEWTVKDVLAHLAAWHGEVAIWIARTQQGAEIGPAINESVDEWNNARVTERRRLPLVDVMQEFNDTFDQLVAALAQASAERIPLGPDGWNETARLWWLTEHDDEHRYLIEAYRQRLAQLRDA